MSVSRSPLRNQRMFSREQRADAQRTAAIIFAIVFAAAFALVVFIVVRPGI